MKKALLISVIILMLGGVMFSQNNAQDQKSAPKDSITEMDMQKHIYMMASDIYQYNSICYKDSIDITEFYGKQINSLFWKNKGRFYWDPFEPLPQNVKFLHWRPTYEGYVEFLTQRYSPPQK